MPLLARLFVKTAFGWLVLALAVGVAMAVGALGRGPAWLAVVGPSQVHLFTMGWLTQLIFGVAYWFFPRVSKARPHGRPGPVWTAYALLNAGLVARTLAEPAVALGGGVEMRTVLVGAAAAQTAAVLLMCAHLWTRVRAR